MNTILIKKNPNGDTRTADHIPTFKEFKNANVSHIKDVSSVIDELSYDLHARGFRHDITKISHDELFYHDLCATMNGEMKFEDGEWAKIHYNTERHHLNRVTPEDVNLIDVLEMIVDCVCAGMARSGSVRPIKITDTVLQMAVRNTAKMIEDAIEITEE